MRGRGRGCMSSIGGLLVIVMIIGGIYFAGATNIGQSWGNIVGNTFRWVDKKTQELVDGELNFNDISDIWKGEQDQQAGQAPEGGFTGDLSGDSERVNSNMAALENNVNLPGSMEGYDRDTFSHWDKAEDSPGWEEIGNGKCNVREAALIRDGVEVDYSRSCDIKSGTWTDTYGNLEANGEVAHVTVTDASLFDADHIVPLAEAWRSGANEWDDEKKADFANDADNIKMTAASVNRSKSDQSVATYIPPHSSHPDSFRCEYLDRYSHVKAKYGLSVAPAELDALRQGLAECGVQ